MKKTVVIIFLSILCFSSIGQNVLEDLRKDRIVNQIFEEKNYNSLLLILNLYDNWVTEKTGIFDIDSAYHVFSENVKYNNSIEDVWDKTKLPQCQLDSIILSCTMSRTFKRIWNYDFLQSDNQIDSFYVNLCINSELKYGDYLRELSKENEGINDYIVAIESAGCIPPTALLYAAWTHENYDFSKVHWRLFYAIHFVTINYKVVYFKNYS